MPGLPLPQSAPPTGSDGLQPDPPRHQYRLAESGPTGRGLRFQGQGLCSGNRGPAGQDLGRRRVGAGTHLQGLARGRHSSDGVNTGCVHAGHHGGQGPGGGALCHQHAPHVCLDASQAVGPTPAPSSLSSPSPYPLPAFSLFLSSWYWRGSNGVPLPPKS